MANPANQLADEAIKRHLSGKYGFWKMWAHDVAQRAKIRRKSLAKEAGLPDDSDVGPVWPDSQRDSRVYIKHGGGYLAGAMTSLLTAGAGAALVYFALKAEPPPKPETKVETRTDSTVHDYEVDARIVPPAEP